MRLTRGAFWSLTGSLCARVLSLAGGFAVARILGRVGFGELGIIQNTVNTFQVFAVFGLGATATKYVAQLRMTDRPRVGRILGLSSCIAVITGAIFSIGLFFAAPFLARHVLAAPPLAGALRIGSGLLFFVALNGAQTGALAGLEAFQTMARVNLIYGVTTFVLMVSGALAGGLHGILWGLLIAAAVNWVVTGQALASRTESDGITVRVRDSWREISVLWSFSLPAVLANVMTAAALWASSAVLVNQPGGYADMGAYSAVYRIKQAPEMILGALWAPLLPILSSAHGKGDAGTFSKTTRVAFAMSITTLIPVSLIQIAIPAVSLIAYGSEFRGCTAIVQWLMFQTAIVGVCLPIGQIQMSMGRMWLGAIYNFSWACLFVGMTFLLAPQYLGVGMAAASAVAYVVTSVPLFAYLYRCEGTYLAGTPFWKLLIGMPALSGICWFAGMHWNSIVSGAVSICAIAVTLYTAYAMIPTRASGR
jgi:O-antigen/teichoic acid export membrane protein